MRGWRKKVGMGENIDEAGAKLAEPTQPYAHLAKNTEKCGGDAW